MGAEPPQGECVARRSRRRQRRDRSQRAVPGDEAGSGNACTRPASLLLCPGCRKKVRSASRNADQTSTARLCRLGSRAQIDRECAEHHVPTSLRVQHMARALNGRRPRSRWTPRGRCQLYLRVSKYPSQNPLRPISMTSSSSSSRTFSRIVFWGDVQNRMLCPLFPPAASLPAQLYHCDFAFCKEFSDGSSPCFLGGNALLDKRDSEIFHFSLRRVPLRTSCGDSLAAAVVAVVVVNSELRARGLAARVCASVCERGRGEGPSPHRSPWLMPTMRSGRSDGLRRGGASAPFLLRCHGWAVQFSIVTSVLDSRGKPSTAGPGVVAVTRNLLEPDQPRPRSRRWVVPDVTHSRCE
jgi:hypothetical protein